MTTATVPGRELVELVERSPIRRRILEAIPLAEPGAGVSPVELSRRLGIRLGTVAYHVRVLAHAGVLELVAERRVRGAVEHRYDVTSAGQAAHVDTPLEVAIAALEAIRDESVDWVHAGTIATAALERLGRRTNGDAATHGTAGAVSERAKACLDCTECMGNGVEDDGYPCTGCEGTGCDSYPFCNGDHENQSQAR